jgi:hypothetical protein
MTNVHGEMQGTINGHADVREKYTGRETAQVLQEHCIRRGWGRESEHTYLASGKMLDLE